MLMMGLYSPSSKVILVIVLLTIKGNAMAQDYDTFGLGSGDDSNSSDSSSTVFPETEACDGNPCHNGGMCFEDEGVIYLCGCLTGYTGNLCQTEIDECGSNPCLNNGVCENRVGMYVCQCPYTHTGTQCETELPEAVETINNALSSVNLTAANAKAVTSKLTSVVDSLNLVSTSADMDASTSNNNNTPALTQRTEARTKIVDLISSLSESDGPVSLGDIQAMTKVLGSVTSAPDELSPKSIENSISALGNLFSKATYGSQLSDAETKSLSEEALKTSGNLFGAVFRSAPDVASSNPSSQSASPAGNNVITSEDVAEKLDTFVDDLSNSLLHTLDEGESFAMDSSSLSVRVGKVLSQPGKDSSVQTSFGDLTLPSDLVEEGKSLSIKAVAYEGNMLSYGRGGSQTNTPMLKLNLKDENDQNIEYTQQPLSLAIDTGQAANDSVLEVDASNCTAWNPMVHKYKINSQQAALQFSFRRGSATSTYDILGRIGAKPTDAQNNFWYHLGEDIGEKAENVKVAKRYDGTTIVIFLYASSLEITDETDVFILVRCLGEDPKTTQSPVARKRRAVSGPSGSMTYLNGTYGMGATMFEPRYWDAEAKSWKVSSSLEVDETSTTGKIKFRSNFMGSFCAGVFTPPNTIDFDNVLSNFSSLLSDNWTVLAVVCSLIVLYIPLAILSRRTDKRDKLLWDYMPLIDNRPAHEYFYLISVYTGNKIGAGTSANAFIQLEGAEFSAPPRVLRDGSNKSTIERGSLNNFLMSCPVHLGELEHIVVWHDGTESRDDWYLEKILITDVTLKKSYLFSANSWLSEERGERTTYKFLHPMDEESMKTFDYLFPEHARLNLFDSHVWFSVAKRPNPSRFSRLQRLSTCLALLFLSMVTSAIWFGTEPDNNPGLQIGPVWLSFHTLYVSIMGSVVIIPPTIFIMEIFRRTAPRKEKVKPINLHESYEIEPPLPSMEVDFEADRYITKRCFNIKSTEEEIRELSMLMDFNVVTDDISRVDKNQTGTVPAKKRSLRFPWWFVFVGYFLVFASVFLGGFFCLFYSLDWGKEKSHQWLLSIFLCSAQNILIMQPIKVFVMSLFFACIMHVPKHIEDEFSVEELRNKNKRQKAVAVQVPQPSYVPGKLELQESVLRRARARQEEQQDVRLFTHFREFGLQLVTVLLILVICYANRDSLTYHQNEAVKNGLPIHKVREFRSLWTWFDDILVTFVLPSRDYSGSSLSSYDSRFTANDNGYRMTQLRLRQIRVNIDTVKERRIRDMVPHFRRGYSEGSRDKRHFGPGWKTELRNISGIPMTPFMYQEGNDKLAADIHGKFASYSNGGHIADLGHDPLEASRVLSYLKKNRWIDQHTAAVLAEINIFNANLNLMSRIHVLIEIPTTSGLHCQVLVHTFRPYPYVDSWDFVFLLIQIAWVCYMLFLVTRAAAKFIKQKAEFFKEPWNWIDCILICLSFLSIGFFVMRCLTIVAVVEEIRNNKGIYVSTGALQIWDEAYGYTVAACLFISTMTLFRPMIFSEALAKLKFVLYNSLRTIGEFGGIFIIFLIAFGTSVVIGLGSVSEEFSTISSAMTTQFAMTLIGFKEFHGGNIDDVAMSKVLLFIFHASSQIIFMNMFVSFMYTALSFVRSNEHLVAQNKELSDQVWKKLEKWMGHLTGKKDERKKKNNQDLSLKTYAFFELDTL